MVLAVLLLTPALQPHLAHSRSRRARLRLSASPEAGSFELELFSPARLSLFLRVCPRGDSLHDIARLSQAVDLGDRLQLARIPATSSMAAGVVRPSRKTDPIKQHCEFSTTPADLPGLPTCLLTVLEKRPLVRRGGVAALPSLAERTGRVQGGPTRPRGAPDPPGPPLEGAAPGPPPAHAQA